MTAPDEANNMPAQAQHDAAIEAEKVEDVKSSRWKKLLGGPKATKTSPMSRASSDGFEDLKSRPEKWSLGVLNDKETDEVPGMWFQHPLWPSTAMTERAMPLLG
jgi:hypothetical protein